MKKLFYLLISILALSCQSEKPDVLFYKRAEVLDIKRDDESQYHLLIKYENGSVESLADVQCYIHMGHFKPCIDMPFVKWDNGNRAGTLEAWKSNSTSYSYMSIDVYLPNDYKIELFND